ncbi:MAG: response regulator transcription factor [Saprospiraceae bacterium]|nr:response regulator transcription factor [Saprospiraceae bacterium]
MPTKILYVEDEVFLGKIVKESLETRGYDVRWVKDGSDALSAFQTELPDICVLDVMLPGKDGFTIGKEIRQAKDDVPIIYLTAKDQTGDVLKGFTSGGNDYIKKPFSMEELIVRIENLLNLSKNGRPPGDQEEIRLGQYVFHPLRMELQHAETTHKLSHRENELLKILAFNKNLPVERKRILKEIWGDDSFFNSRNLDVYITRLRKYFKGDPGLQINTLKGVGYQFVVEG